MHYRPHASHCLSFLVGMTFWAVPLVSAEAAPWQSLFDGKKLGTWKVANRFDFINHGKVEVANGQLLLGKGEPLTGIRYTGNLPRIDYEIELEAMKVDGEDFFCGLTFPVGEQPCTLIVGGWNGPIVGLSNVDGQPASENETTAHIEFAKNRWYRIRLRVTKAKIEVWLDDKQVIDLATKGHKFSIWFEQETVLPLGIASYETKAALRNLRIRSLAAKATATAEQ